jgi:hypothetical protein
MKKPVGSERPLVQELGGARECENARQGSQQLVTAAVEGLGSIEACLQAPEKQRKTNPLIKKGFLSSSDKTVELYPEGGSTEGSKPGELPTPAIESVVSCTNSTARASSAISGTSSTKNLVWSYSLGNERLSMVCVYTGFLGKCKIVDTTQMSQSEVSIQSQPTPHSLTKEPASSAIHCHINTSLLCLAD